MCRDGNVGGAALLCRHLGFQTASGALLDFRRHYPTAVIPTPNCRAVAVFKDYKNPSFPRRRESGPLDSGNIQRLSESPRF
ncbi:hypothetical protein NEILACOT_04370 [Neisseria lactamica ATCC 23970]|uniref:SRCR domain-containing protein n=1 Tax=Neisseria lactamica ATCC 23970 TaxID=546265 RepID=D0WA05_NEILA|nr:hypothetical protein NEILACOT_04370 [Neisseria lactamica ATCC 23970]